MPASHLKKRSRGSGRPAATRGDRREGRHRVREDLHERRELRRRVEPGDREAFVVGTFCSAFDRCTSVVRVGGEVLDQQPGLGGMLGALGDGDELPPTREPILLGDGSAAGNGAVLYLTVDLSLLMNALRHSPSYSIATRPRSKSLADENSWPFLRRSPGRLSEPYQSISYFCHVRSCAQRVRRDRALPSCRTTARRGAEIPRTSPRSTARSARSRRP